MRSGQSIAPQKLTFVLGGARSGKRAYAQASAEAAGAGAAGAGAAAAPAMATPVMIVTAQAFDAEMSDRIARHRADRGDRWRTVEAPLDLAAAVDALAPGDVAVIDCLTLWLTNLILGGNDVVAARDGLLAALARTPARLWVVSNEVGLGIVPDNALSRRFRDEAGRLHQALAARADEVVLLVAGLPLTVKPRSETDPIPPAIVGADSAP